MREYFFKLWNKSVRFQLMYGFGFILILFSISYSIIHVNYQKNFVKKSSMNQMLNLSLSLAKSSKVWVLANDYVGLESVLNDISMYDNLEYAAIFNNDGKVIAHTNHELFGKYVADQERIKYFQTVQVEGLEFSYKKILLNNDSYIDLIRPIDEAKKHIGHVQIRLNQDLSRQEINSIIFKGILFTSFFILIGLGFAYLVGNGLTRRLSKLMQAVQRFADGKKDEIIDESGVTEISKLSHEFNQLINNLNDAELKNKQLQERLELAFIGTQDGLWDWDILHDKLYFSPRWKEIIGYADHELANNFTEWEERVHQDDLANALRDVEQHFQSRGNVEYKNIHRLQHKDGHWVWILARGKALFNEEGKAIRMVGTHTDVTKETIERAEHEHILEYQANHDSLTGLPNRCLFLDRLNHGVDQANRHQSVFAVLFIDLDRFKQINDSLGHDIGDAMLIKASERIQNVIRKEDTLARLGGDEFTVLMQDLKNPQDASKVARKILQAFVDPIVINENTLYISCSIGIALYPNDAKDAVSILKDADAAMYKAKDEGKNNFQFYTSDMTKKASEYISLESSLREALENEEFEVYYQAQVDGNNDKTMGMEALIRWVHPTKGLIPPSEFIPFAEETGLIVLLDQWVMKTAMKQFMDWVKRGLNPGKLSLNLEMKQLETKDFLTTLETILEETECHTEYLEFELTEGSIMKHPERSIVLLQEISQKGISLAVDDFGTGYSSLAYLKKLPINKLKIDQSFIQDLPDDEEDIGITKSIIALANILKLDVIAEGVETKDQKDFLVTNGCRCIQGYFYTKPMPANEFEKYLEDSTLTT